MNYQRRTSLTVAGGLTWAGLALVFLGWPVAALLCVVLAGLFLIRAGNE